jgi:hypothetical protein
VVPLEAVVTERARPCSFGHPRHRQFVVEIVHDAGPELDERRHDASPERQGVAFSLGVELIVPRFAYPVAADDDEAPLPRRRPIARQPDDRAEQERAVD